MGKEEEEGEEEKEEEEEEEEEKKPKEEEEAKEEEKLQRAPRERVSGARARRGRAAGRAQEAPPRQQRRLRSTLGWDPGLRVPRRSPPSDAL